MALADRKGVHFISEANPVGELVYVRTVKRLTHESDFPVVSRIS